MKINVLPHPLTVAKLNNAKDAPKQGFVSLTATGQEVSLVCETAYVPKTALAREDGWRALGIDGQLEFSLVGVLAEISAILAESGVPIFVLSTYDTDYILVKNKNLAAACDALTLKGYIIQEL